MLYVPTDMYYVILTNKNLKVAFTIMQFIYIAALRDAEC